MSSLVLNMVGGGGSITAYAYIIAEHPSSGTVTCTNSTKSYPLSSTTELFLVSNNATSCVVSCSGVSKTVQITQGQSYYVDLSGVLYQAGDTSGWTAVGWASASGFSASTPALTYGSSALEISQTTYHSGITYHAQKIDLTGYSTVTAHGDITYTRSSTADGVGLYILESISLSGYYPNVAVAKAQVGTGTKTDYTLSVDVSSLTGEYYVALGSVITTTLAIDSVYCGT